MRFLESQIAIHTLNILEAYTQEEGLSTWHLDFNKENIHFSIERLLNSGIFKEKYETDALQTNVFQKRRELFTSILQEFEMIISGEDFSVHNQIHVFNYLGFFISANWQSFSSPGWLMEVFNHQFNQLMHYFNAQLTNEDVTVNDLLSVGRLMNQMRIDHFTKTGDISSFLEVFTVLCKKIKKLNLRNLFDDDPFEICLNFIREILERIIRSNADTKNFLVNFIDNYLGQLLLESFITNPPGIPSLENTAA